MIFHKFPKGTYYIGDIIYAISEENRQLFDQVANIGQISNRNYDDGKFLYKDQLCFIGKSMAEGLFYDSNDREYIIESKIMGLIPVEVCDNISMLDDGGNIYQFSSDFYVEYENGKFVFDSIELEAINNPEEQSYFESDFIEEYFETEEIFNEQGQSK